MKIGTNLCSQQAEQIVDLYLQQFNRYWCVCIFLCMGLELLFGKQDKNYSGSKADVLTCHNICSLTNWDNANRLQQMPCYSLHWPN